MVILILAQVIMILSLETAFGLNGRLSQTVIGRLSLSHNSNDGFVFNDFLNKDYTNNIDD